MRAPPTPAPAPGARPLYPAPTHAVLRGRSPAAPLASLRTRQPAALSCVAVGSLASGPCGRCHSPDAHDPAAAAAVLRQPGRESAGREGACK